MAGGGDEREKRRGEGIESEREDASPDSTRVIVGYWVAAVVVLAVAVVVVVLASGGDSGAAESSAHINLDASVGSTNGVEPDNRAGTPPPPVKVSNLTAAARKAGCALRLKLPDEGHEHIPPRSPPPRYQNKPPTAGA